ncbi:hypothetical protein P5618_015485 [Priestia megaterium]|uniref:hypothetical protein n=2 Tax=Priestia TaxID=2800373 RepID=UPI000412B8ED|nr:hypothetical protein [Priestia megaterium]ANF46768.1 hypothetical protein AZK53_14080 [Priestia megaterium]AQU74462.1 hypothetical protein BUW91_14655 [Priestia megaterium]MCU7763546.1 hypothetical protein [Priestia megaterium]MDH3180849.1 hypothetical protein [Priestia megaterium]MDR4220842.1 hypothetical protein [Priestia megaterium]
MIVFTCLIIIISIIRPYLESVTVKRLASEGKKVRYYKEQFFFYVLILLFYIAVMVYHRVPISMLGLQGVYLDTIHRTAPYPAWIEYLLLLIFAGFIILSIMLQWMKDHGETVFVEQEMPTSIEATVPKTEREQKWWLAYSGISSFVESTVYFPSFYLYSHYILAIENTWVLAVLIGIGYFLSQLAFQRDRLSVQTLLVGIGLGALFIMTKSVVIMVLYYGFSFLIYDIYQQDRNLVKSTDGH